VAGDTVTLTATVRDADGATLTGFPLTWISLDPQRLQALTSGRFVALEGGEMRAAVQAGSAADTVTMDAEERRVTMLLATVASKLFVTGDDEGVVLQARDQRQRPMEPGAIEWTTSAPQRMTVSDDGHLTALAAGAVTIGVRTTGSTDPVTAELTLEIVPGDGVRVPELARVDSLVVAWMQTNAVPGAQVAVMREGRLVLSRAYGVRDVSTGEPVSLDALFRIGSLSKPIAGLAFLQLVDEGLVSLEDRPFEALLQAYDPIAGESVDPRLADVTAREVLRHQSGYGDRSVDDRVYRGVWEFGANDPVDVFRHGLGVALDHDPGTVHAYTNFSTQTIARYIELRVAMDYEQYVRQALFLPAGVTRMEYGRGPLGERHPDEVRHHDAQGQIDPLIDANAHAMVYYDASGSWLGTATDLMRLMRHVEGLQGATPLVSTAALAEIATANPDVSGGATQYYGLHWGVRLDAEGPTWSHTGAAEGAWALLMRRADGTTFAILTNRDFDGGALHLNLEPALVGVDWPALDLFTAGAAPGAGRVR
jgi:N-acyl-D-amino-acid deacylase